MGSKLLDLLFAASFAWWSAETIYGMGWTGISLAGVCTAVIHLLVALAFVVRQSPQSQVTHHDCLAVFPSLVVGGMASQVAGATLRWPLVSSVIFALGASLAAISIFHLGRSFAVLPYKRPLITNGVYGLVRHPMYLGELLMIAACCTTKITWFSVAVLVLVLPAIANRILVEELRLGSSDDHRFRNYAALVKWRLLPLIW